MKKLNLNKMETLKGGKLWSFACGAAVGLSVLGVASGAWVAVAMYGPAAIGGACAMAANE
jgi:hypothetical protein